jgi:hypothetical protein
VKRFGVMVIVVAAVAGLAVPGASASVASKQKQVSAEKYAKTVCGSYLKVADAVTSFDDDVTALPVDDAAAFQTQVVTRTGTLVDDVTKVQTKLKKSYPDVDGGKTFSKLFVSNMEELKTGVTDALEKFRAADATSPAFVGDISVFQSAFTVLQATLSDPFSKVDAQDLLGAFKDEKSCKKVVTIYGG